MIRRAMWRNLSIWIYQLWYISGGGSYRLVTWSGGQGSNLHFCLVEQGISPLPDTHMVYSPYFFGSVLDRIIRPTQDLVFSEIEFRK